MAPEAPFERKSLENYRATVVATVPVGDWKVTTNTPPTTTADTIAVAPTDVPKAAAAAACPAVTVPPVTALCTAAASA